MYPSLGALNDKEDTSTLHPNRERRSSFKGPNYDEFDKKSVTFDDSLPSEESETSVPADEPAHAAPMEEPIHPPESSPYGVPRVRVRVAPVERFTPFGPDAVEVMCPNCHNEVKTTVEKYSSSAAYVSAAILCLIGCSCGCCFIPFCMESCKTTEHNCSNCNNYLGKFSRY